MAAGGWAKKRRAALSRRAAEPSTGAAQTKARPNCASAAPHADAMASSSAAAVPSAGLVLMIIVLESVGLNPAWIALIFPVDRILDMCRTVVNVTGDGAVSTLIAHSEGELEVPEA